MPFYTNFFMTHAYEQAASLNLSEIDTSNFKNFLCKKIGKEINMTKLINESDKTGKLSGYIRIGCNDYDVHLDQETGNISISILNMYDYATKSWGERDLQKDELIQLTKQFVNDVNLLKKKIGTLLRSFLLNNGLTLDIYFEKGSSSEHVKYVTSYIQKYGDFRTHYAPAVSLIVKYPNNIVQKNYEEFVKKSTLVNKRAERISVKGYNLTDVKKAKYLKTYGEFMVFLQHPHKLNKTLCGGAVKDFCIILDISIQKLNQIIAKNIKTVGEKIRISPNWFDDLDYGNTISKKLGECYCIEESFDAEMIVWSINKKKLYSLDFEHCECVEFWKDYPYDIKDLEDAVYGYDDSLKNALKNLFEEYNKSHHVKFFIK